tara:strand:- start:885 stop:1733 length:849 start_codon:yes stop_codon:yes gene_type:complete
MKTSRVYIKPTGSKIGAIVHNVDLNNKISPEEHNILQTALTDYQVIFFENQILETAQQKVATKIFGPLLPSETFFDHPDGDPEVEAVINDENSPPIGTAIWHSDLTWASEPPGGTSLYALKTPVGKGDTIWSSMTAVYDSLSDGMKTYLNDLTAVHSWDMGFGGREIIFKRGQEIYVNHKSSNPPVEHPVIRTHPLSGRKLIYVNSTFTSHIVGLPKLESEGILEFLFGLVTRPENQVRHRWQEGTLAVWDNTATQHSVVDDFYPEYRELRRVTFGGHGKPA